MTKKPSPEPKRAKKKQSAKPAPDVPKITALILPPIDA